MKKILAVTAAVLLIALSVIPAFAANIDSPTAPHGNYQITIVPGPGGGGDYDFVTGVDDDGNQTVHVIAKPNDGYTFTGWTIEGDYKTNGKLTDAELDLIVHGDIKLIPNYSKNGENVTPDTKVDNGTKSPKTGYSASTIVALSLCSLAVVGLVFVARKRKEK